MDDTKYFEFRENRQTLQNYGTVVSVFGVEPRRIGGTENFARELSIQLAQNNWRSVLCFLTEPPEDVRQYLSLPNVSIEVIEDSWRHSYSATKSLVSILRKYRPTVLHLHYIGFLSLFPWVGRLVSTERTFFTDHSSRPQSYVTNRAPVWKRLFAQFINWPITNVLCVSDYNYRCMTALDVLPADRFKCIYNGVDLSRVVESQERADRFRRRYAIPANRTVITQVSSLIPEKGLPDLLTATRELLSKEQNIQLVLVGDGAYRQEYEKLSAELGLDGHVTWAGLVQDPFEEGVYDAADVVCQVSRWQEAFGWVLAEAMAYRKPVVGTTVGGIPEVVEDGKCGFLVDPGNPSQIAERLLQLVRDDALRKRMGEAGREIVRRKFDMRKNVADTLEFYGVSRSLPESVASKLPLEILRDSDGSAS